MDCGKFNQYYTDVVIDGKIVNERCFKGSEIYKNFDKFKVNDYLNFDSEGYYNWINNSFQQYAFPDEKFNLAGYNPEAVYQGVCNPVEYSLKPQQKFAGRIMNTHIDNRGLLIYHGLGSGKTQTSIVVGEAFKFKNVEDSIINGRADSKVFIVVPAALIDQYYNEIIGQLEKGQIKSASGQVLINGDRQYYLDPITRRAIIIAYKNIEELEEKIKIGGFKNKQEEYSVRQLLKSARLRADAEKSKVNRVYEIISHQMFLNKIFTFKDKVFTPGPYLPLLKIENSLIIIDEVQKMVSGVGSSYRKLLYALKYYTDRNVKLICLTGTPIYDKPYEFGLLMNLLRPRLLFPDGYDEFNKVFLDKNVFINRDLFKQMCSGYVSYFKGGNPESYPYKKTTVMLHMMSPYQYGKYVEVLDKEVERLKKSSKDEPEVFLVKITTSEKTDDDVPVGIFNNSNLFCNIVFPEAKLNEEEKKRLTKKSLLDANIREFTNVLSQARISFEGDTEIVKIQRMIQQVSLYSTKFAKVAELILASEGPVFVYSNYVYYGVESMSIVMSFLGYAAYPNKGPRGSYFVWKGEANVEEIPKAKALFNSKENKDGSLLKIMFGTQTVMEGVDFKNVRQVHILDPWWNDSRMQQVIARSIRLCSHKELPADKRIVDVFIHLAEFGQSSSLHSLKIMKLDALGLTENEKTVNSYLIPENPDEPNRSMWVYREIFIKVNKENESTLYPSKDTFLASKIIPGTIKKIADPTLKKLIGGFKDLDEISVQQYMYSKALTKLNINRKFETAIKEVAIDCNLNKNGNIVRLEECYVPRSEDQYSLYYENYQTGERYTRLDIPEYFSLKDILNNKAKNSGKYRFKSLTNSETFRINESLIVPENINCSVPKYQIDSAKIPEGILTLSTNKEFIPILMQMKRDDLVQYFYDVQMNQVRYIDRELPKKLALFLSKDDKAKKKVILDRLEEMGIGERIMWETYPLDRLKKELKYLNLNIK
jgi:hypothetical protein